MARIYASFRDPDLAEKATGALMDHGVLPEHISLVRGGKQSDFPNTIYGNVSPRSMDEDRNIEGVNYGGSGYGAASVAGGNAAGVAGNVGEYAPEAQRPDAVTDQRETELIDRRDTDYQYGDTETNFEGREVHERAADRLPHSDYVENRSEMDTEGNEDDLSAKAGISTTTPADAGSGALKGTAVGAGVGVVAGLAALFIPGAGLVLGGGALMTALAGLAGAAGAGAAAGAVTGYLKDQGVEAHVAEEYDRTIQSGGCMIEVDVPSGEVDETTVREVLEKYGAQSLSSTTGRGYVS